MLSFLNPLILLSLPLAALPIIINLIRPRIRLQFDWPSLYLLRRAEKKRARRRIRLIEIVLIALRVLIILSAVLLLSRPFISSGGRGSADVVIILDDSLSMGYVDAGESRFSRAKESVSETLDTLNDSGRIALATTSNPYTADWGTLPDIRGELAAAARRSDNRLGSGLNSAVKLLRDSKKRKEIHIFTDCQQNGFADWPDTIDRDITIIIHDVRNEPGPFQNLALTGYDIDVLSSETAVIRVSGFGDVSPQRLEWDGGYTSVGKGELDFAKVPLSTIESTLVSVSDDSFAFDNTLELPISDNETVSYFISPEVAGPYFDAALWSLGATRSTLLSSPGLDIAVSRFGAIPDEAQMFVEDGGLLLLTFLPADKGEAWGLRVESGSVKSPFVPLTFFAPLYDSAGTVGPFVTGLRQAEYDASWSVAAEIASGEPAVLYRQLGDGEIWAVLVPAGPGSAFPVHPTFVSFLGDLTGRAREILTGTPRHIDIFTAESEVDFLNAEDFAGEFPDIVYEKGGIEAVGGWSFDLTLYIFVFLLLLLIAEPILASYVTRKTR